MDDAKITMERAEDLVEIALKRGFAATKFLTPEEAVGIKSKFGKRRDVAVSTEGGIEGAERVRIIFTDAGGRSWGGWRREDVVSVLRIRYRAQDEVGHRDVLGAVMNLGVKRETMGDIWIHEAQAFLVCLPEMAEYVTENLNKIGRVGVVVEGVALEELPDRRDDAKMEELTVPSVRLDAVISGVFHVSRSSAAKLVTQGWVKVDYVECVKPDKELEEGSLVSVRGRGRVRILELGGRTRKDRVRLKVGVYGKP